jgi:hypothetical protein
MRKKENMGKMMDFNIVDSPQMKNYGGQPIPKIKKKNPVIF